MGWRHQWPERAPRPKLKRLSNDQKDNILQTLDQGIALSPVLSALEIRVRALRGRFYLSKPLYVPDEDVEVEIIGRVTPVSGKKEAFLLDAKKMNGNWYEVMQGTIEKIVLRIAKDTRGTFHGLGALEKSLRRTDNVSKLPDIEMQANYRFIYTNTGEECTVQEVLYHVFGLPIPVIAEPREWYAYRRTPKIVEINKKKTCITVEFSKMDMYYGREITDTCLYKKQAGKWDIFD